MTQISRALDHCVLPVPDLETARARYRALGFTVAPGGTHPFGTINACVYLADDTFLEPLAIGNQADVDRAARDGNMFVARDAAYRQAVGDNGFSALVFKTDDAQGDHAGFVDAGVSAGPVLDFSRAFVDPAGTAGTVSFRLAFAAPPSSEASYFFTCQRIDAPSASGRAALESHANGVVGMAGITLTAAHPSDHRNFLATLTGARIEETEDGLVASLGNCRIWLNKGPGDLQLSTIHFRVRDLATTQAALEAGGIAFDRLGNGFAVDPAPGQGAIFTFEDKT